MTTLDEKFRALEAENAAGQEVRQHTGDLNAIIHGALFLALGATVATGTKVALVEPDYFANRKLVSFFGGELVPVSLRAAGSNQKILDTWFLEPPGWMEKIK